VFTLDAQRSPQVDACCRKRLRKRRPRQKVVLAREVRANGRALCRVNGRAVSQSVLRQLGELLIDAHGQSEHLSLLRVREHVNLLDTYAGGWELRKAVADKVAALRETRKDIEDITAHARERARRVDMLKFQLEESGRAAQPNEEEA
jgi:DNA repair protein RecN (Recombination protein N)